VFKVYIPEQCHASVDGFHKAVFKCYIGVEFSGSAVFQDGNTIPRPFIPGLNENVNFFNVDAFLSWDFKLGCNLTVGYKNWIGDNLSVDGIKYSRYLNNFGKSFDESHGNEFTIKFIYFLDYNQLRKKK